jgi:ATP synthase protein I
MRERTRRDLDRLQRREPGGGFWRGLALVGSVGWPIVLLATGGALLGHYLDVRWGTGIRWALILVTAGAVAGSWMAYRSLREGAS